ncbi:unnamed protein product [Soboliphyme baturini]|uniref:Solute carrier organic anion transporter family member n=1 Tax=Soboliphyme baturini TaxID=241478 RepID=A0A183ISF4_9BILA|nr:unnamed protein product [Soboliphyme baturini]
MGSSLFDHCSNIWTLLTLFCLCYFLETITFTYLISAVQSIERQFQIPSRMSGGLVASSDIGYTLTVVVLAYFGSRSNRARWIGGGCLVISFACFLIALPNFVYRSQGPCVNNSDWQTVDLVSYNEINTPTKLVNHPLLGCSLRRCWNIVDGASVASLTNGLVKASCGHEEVRSSPSAVHRGRFSTSVICFDYGHEVCDQKLKSLRAHFPLNESVTFNEASIGALLSYFNNELDWEVKRLWLRNVKTTAQQPFALCNRLVNDLKQATEQSRCEQKSTNSGAFTMMAMGMILYGVGHSMPWTLGVPLIDDNVKKQSTPLYFAFIFFIRILGPVLGFVIGAGCNKLYYDLKNELNLVHTDPSWIGAWWLGFLLISACLFPPAVLLLFFPDLNIQKNRKPPRSTSITEKTDYQEQATLVNNGMGINKDTVYKDCVSPNAKLKQSAKETLREIILCLELILDFLLAIKEVFRSPVYTVCLIGRLFDAFAFKGFFVFQPKYLENHYGMPQYQGNMLLGVVGILGFAIGVIMGSIILRRYRLNGRAAALFVAACTATSSLLAFSKILLACQSTVNQLGANVSGGHLNFTSSCILNCHCDEASLFPVCSLSGRAYYSPCHAGCSDYERTEALLNFTDCRCVDVGTTVSRSLCRDDCYIPLIFYFVLITISGIIGGCGVIPGVLILLR